jgi:putative ABC transport system ATP-binding protein
VSASPNCRPVLEARGLHRFFRRGDQEIAALRDVTFNAHPGEVLAIVGPSGSGKSTLLNLLAGLDDPDGGSIWIDGTRFSHRGPLTQARLRGQYIGVLTQASGLIEHLSVLGNVRLAASLRPRPSAANRRKSTTPRALLDAVGLQARHAARPSTLSGGETARANLAVALAGDPLILLADEPTAEVSRSEEAALLGLLREERPKAGATVIVTHSRAVAESADRLLSMTDGKLR